MYWKVTHSDGSAFHWIGPEHFRPPNDKAKRITKEAYERGKASEPRRSEGRMPRPKKERVKHEARPVDKKEASRLRREARKKRKEDGN